MEQKWNNRHREQAVYLWKIHTYGTNMEKELDISDEMEYNMLKQGRNEV